MTLHLDSPYTCSLIKDIHKEASKSTIKSPQDLGFFDLTLQHDFPELRSYNNVYEFINHIQKCKNRYRDADILQMLSKCLREPANQWYRDLLESSDLRSPSRTLKMWLSALEIQFKKTKQTAKSPQQIASQATPNSTPQQGPHYHKYTTCSALFSSLSRLLAHSQLASCSKASCNHCDAIFDSKNKLHKHIRNKNCLKIPSANKSKTAKHSNKNHCYLKRGIDKELTPLTPLSSESTTAALIYNVNPISALETLVISLATPSATPPSTYRAISPSPPVYQSIKPRDYLTINDLFIRYASLKRIKLD